MTGPEVPIDAAAGAPFEVRLASASGGGYLWELRETPAGLRLLDATLQASPGGAPGDAAAQIFRLQADRPGRLVLRFALKRRWEAVPIEERALTVDVR